MHTNQRRHSSGHGLGGSAAQKTYKGVITFNLKIFLAERRWLGLQGWNYTCCALKLKPCCTKEGEHPPFLHQRALHKHTRPGWSLQERYVFLIIKGNSKGKQWPGEHAIQQKPNPEPNSTDGYTACCNARADAREETSHKPNRQTIQSLASGFFSCQPCLMSSHNGWLLCRKQQRKRLKRSMCHTASIGNRQCQVSIAVSCTCQCALEPLLHFQK